MYSEAQYEELVWLHRNSYGTAVRLPRSLLRGLAAALCMVTPCTNWLAPLAFRWIRRDVMVRYER